MGLIQPRPVTQPVITDFSAGELSDKLAGRIDLPIYQKGVEIMENFVPLSTGGATKRPGSKYMFDALANVTTVRLIPFTVDQSNALIVELSAYSNYFYIRAWKNGDIAIPFTSGNLFSTHPITPTQIGELEFINGYNSELKVPCLYLVHQSWKPRIITWASPTITINTFEISGNLWAPLVDYTIGAIVVKFVSTGTGYRCICTTGGKSGTSWNADRTSHQPDGAVYWDYCEDFANPELLEVPCQATNTYPKAVGVLNGRLWFGGSLNNRQTLWASRPFDHNNFSFLDMYESSIQEILQWTAGETYLAYASVMSGPYAFHTITGGTAGTTAPVPHNPDDLLAISDGGINWYHTSITEDLPKWTTKKTYTDMVTDGCAISMELASDENDEICWIQGATDLVVGTSTTEYAIPGAVTGTSIRAMALTRYGSSYKKPRFLGDAIFFLQNGNRKIRQYIYAKAEYNAPDATFVAEDILGTNGAVEMEYTQTPEPRLMCVRADGQLAVLSYNKAMGVMAWHRYTAGGGGLYKSIGVVQGNAGDSVYVVVDRSGTKTIELFTDLFPASQNSCNFLDCSATKTIPAGGEFTLLTWLNGKTVQIVQNGIQLQDQVVASSKITGLLVGATVQVGYSYTSAIKTMRIIDPQSPFMMSNIMKIWARFYKTVNVKFGYANDPVKLEEFSSPTWYSGNKPIAFRGDTSTDACVYIVSDKPLPCTILLLAPIVEVN